MKNDVLDVDNSTTELFISEPINGTPFTMIKKDSLYYVMLGKYRLTEGMDYHHYDTFVRMLEITEWNLVLQLAHIVVMEYEHKDKGGNNE